MRFLTHSVVCGLDSHLSTQHKDLCYFQNSIETKQNIKMFHDSLEILAINISGMEYCHVFLRKVKPFRHFDAVRIETND